MPVVLIWQNYHDRFLEGDFPVGYRAEWKVDHEYYQVHLAIVVLEGQVVVGVFFCWRLRIGGGDLCGAGWWLMLEWWRLDYLVLFADGER